MGDDLRIRFRLEFVTLGAQRLAQFAEVFDDAVVDDRDAAVGVGMGVGLVRASMRRPARVADATVAAERFAHEALAKVAQLALGAPAGQAPALQRGDAGRIIAAIFEAAQRLDNVAGNGFDAENSDYSAHVPAVSFRIVRPFQS